MLRVSLRTSLLSLFLFALVIVAASLVHFATQYFSSAAILDSKVQLVTLTPPPGVHEVEEGEEFSVGMHSPFALDIWYTTDGSSPVKGTWIDYENPNIRNYGGTPIVFDTTTTIRYSAILPVTLQLTPVFTATYRVEVVPKKVVTFPSRTPASTQQVAGFHASSDVSTSSYTPAQVSSYVPFYEHVNKARQWNSSGVRSLLRVFQYGSR